MLTKKDISAFRKMDAIVFRTVNGESVLECIKHEDKNNPFEQRHNIKVKTRGAKNACHVESIYSQANEVSSVIALLKENDEPELYWYKGAWNSERLLKAGLVGDALYLRWQRGKKTMQFLIAVYISSPDYPMVKD